MRMLRRPPPMRAEFPRRSPPAHTGCDASIPEFSRRSQPWRPWLPPPQPPRSRPWRPPPPCQRQLAGRKGVELGMGPRGAAGGRRVPRSSWLRLAVAGFSRGRRVARSRRCRSQLGREALKRRVAIRPAPASRRCRPQPIQHRRLQSAIFGKYACRRCPPQPPHRAWGRPPRDTSILELPRRSQPEHTAGSATLG
jgi:hypothetical protein